MDRLTREQLYDFCCRVCKGDQWALTELEQSLSQEAVRDEALTKVLKLPRSVFNDESTNTTREYIAAADIAALKREPNAAAVEDGRKQGKYRLVYNKGTKKIDKVSNFDGLAVESFDPPGASDE